MYDLRFLNSVSKYPSIPTFHVRDENDFLTDEVVDFGDEWVSLTEKVDGTNGRIFFAPGGYLIGSRDEWLTCERDRVFNTKLRIVEALRPLAEKIQYSEDIHLRELPGYLVVYCEVYGGGIGKSWQQYSTETDQLGVRCFDVMLINPIQLDEMSRWPLANVAAWRDNGGQDFVTDRMPSLMSKLPVERVPQLWEVDNFNEGVPTTHEGIQDAMSTLLRNRAGETQTRVGLDHAGKPEGVVMRNRDRTKIAKFRFEDYTKDQRRREQIERRKKNQQKREKKLCQAGLTRTSMCR